MQLGVVQILGGIYLVLCIKYVRYEGYIDDEPRCPCLLFFKSGPRGLIDVGNRQRYESMAVFFMNCGLMVVGCV